MQMLRRRTGGESEEKRWKGRNASYYNINPDRSSPEQWWRSALVDDSKARSKSRNEKSRLVRFECYGRNNPIPNPSLDSSCVVRGRRRLYALLCGWWMMVQVTCNNNNKRWFVTVTNNHWSFFLLFCTGSNWMQPLTEPVTFLWFWFMQIQSGTIPERRILILLYLGITALHPRNA